jgi:hypothetical protein
MASRLSVLLVASMLLLGCGGGTDGGGKDGGKPADKPAGGSAPSGVKTPAKTSDVMPFPEKTLKDIKGSLAADSKLTEQNLDSYVKYMKSLSELQKGAETDPMAMAKKMQNLGKDCGFKDNDDMAQCMKRVGESLHLLAIMGAAETSANAGAAGGPAAVALKEAYAKAVEDLKKTAAGAGLSEADLRLVHRRLKDLKAVGEEK